MGKTYDIPIIEIFVKGGLIQDITIPKGTNVKVRVKDYDIDIVPDSDEAKDYNIKEDKHGVYEEGIWK